MRLVWTPLGTPYLKTLVSVFRVTVWICLSESGFSASFSVCLLFTVGYPQPGPPQQQGRHAQGCPSLEDD